MRNGGIVDDITVWWVIYKSHIKIIIEWDEYKNGYIWINSFIMKPGLTMKLKK